MPETPSAAFTSRLTGRLLLSVLLLCQSLALPAAGDDPRALVQSTTERLFAQVRAERDALRENPAQLHPLVEQVLMPHVDLERTSRLVLGKHWRRASDGQRAGFVHEFRHLLLRTYATAVVEFADIAVDYLDTRFSTSGEDAIVRTRVRLSDGRPPVDIDYRLGLGDGGWKVFDVTVGGISLVTTYRSSFSEEVRRVGLDGLLEALRERNARTAGI